MPEASIARILTEEAAAGAFTGDSFTLIFNRPGYERYRDRLPAGHNTANPLYAISLEKINYDNFTGNLTALLPLVKGFNLKLLVPQKRRRLVTFINQTIIDYLGRHEIDNTHSIISELTANAEKANLETAIRETGMALGATPAELLRNRLDDVIRKAALLGKRVEIVWKFSPKIFKVEIKNNTIIPEYALNAVRSKMGAELTTLADGYVGEVFDKLGAGLGLYFINFFSDEIKEKYGFETIFRIFNNQTSTSASLTVFFENPV